MVALFVVLRGLSDLHLLEYRSTMNTTHTQRSKAIIQRAIDLLLGQAEVFASCLK